jgi:hypothetical protein
MGVYVRMQRGLYSFEFELLSNCANLQQTHAVVDKAPVRSYNNSFLTNKETYMSKHLVLIRDVICQYHPKFRRSKYMREYALNNPMIFNVERLIEESFAAVGPYSFIDAAHADFSDGTDSKTASIRENPSKQGSNTYRGEITGVETAGGGQKIGSLRCTIFNPHTDSLMYYFLPKCMWSQNITIHPSSGVGKVVYSYNRIHDEIIKFDGYRLNTFEELARAS